MQAVIQTRIPSLGEPRRGKVREVYDLGDDLLIVATDRISAFDVVMANGVHGKGVVLNQLSGFWFDRLKGTCPNHVVSLADDEVAARLGASLPELHGRCTIARRAEPLTIECVARGFIAGSLYKDYKALGGRVHGLDLPDGLIDGSKLPDPIFTPATKAQEGHDENITFEQAADRVGREVAELARDWTLKLFRLAAAHAATCGLILADTKFEFGLTPDGMIWIDEALTPDSSRFWETALWRPGGPQPSFDKQYVRDYLEGIGWDKKPPGPTLPDDVVAGTQSRYLEAFRRLTGHELALP
ncbi:MAG: phosphoribosylaminoimidazolesuccinocarboxamide synthase [Fimbriimonadaceae bacterium]